MNKIEGIQIEGNTISGSTNYSPDSVGLNFADDATGLKASATLTLMIAVPVGDRTEVDFDPLIASIEGVVVNHFPDAAITEPTN